MRKEELLEAVVRIFHECPGNVISESIAICPEVSGIEMFEEPLVGIGSADDSLYQTFKEETVIGPWHMTPVEWLPGAKSVVSLFFPFTEEVKSGNRLAYEGPAPAWLHGRIEGQEFISAFMERLTTWLSEQGITNCAPGIDGRFRKMMAGNDMREYPGVNENSYGSNWSERHTAFVCGLGTFGLSKGIITKKGMAGRLASVILTIELPVDEREYKEVYEYCTQCGACVRRCLAHAISIEEGKDHNKCNAWLKQTKELYAPRFGCGLCQTKVPCESGIPKKRIEEVVLVDMDDNEVGKAEKLHAHEQGLLHRAFSVFLFHGDSVLMQKRAKEKYHCGGLWTNTCCSHPRKGELVKDAAIRRLREELRICTEEIEEVHSFVYCHKFDNGLTEFEFDHVLVGEYDGTWSINPIEVERAEWMKIEDVKKQILKSPEEFTPWFIVAFGEAIKGRTK